MQLSNRHLSGDWRLAREDTESTLSFWVQRLRGSKINKPVGESDQSVRSVPGSLRGHPAGSLVSALCLSWEKSRRGWAQRFGSAVGKIALPAALSLWKWISIYSVLSSPRRVWVWACAFHRNDVQALLAMQIPVRVSWAAGSGRDFRDLDYHKKAFLSPTSLSTSSIFLKKFFPVLTCLTTGAFL